MNVFYVAVIVVAVGMVSQVVQDRGLKPASPVNLRTGKAFALIIATDDYDDRNWPHLQNPVNDARTIAAELRKNYGYEEPDLLLNPTLEQVSAMLRAYLQRTFAPQDSLLIFIAGHGKFDESIKEGYLVFKDSKHDDPLNDTYLAHSKLRKVVDSIPSRRILLVIDACFGGTIDDRVATRGASALDYPQASKAEIIARKSEMKTRLFLTSGGKEYVPDGKPGANSPFAAQLLSALRTYGGDSGLVTFQDLFQRAESAKGPQPQYGWFGTADPGSDFWFATDHVTLPTAPAVPDASAPVTEAKIKTRVNPIDGLTYVYIPPGTFTMGCSPGDTQCAPNEKPAEAEDVARGFWLGQVEVTQKAWKELNGGENPSDHRGNQLPVDHLSWKEADAYCKAIGGRLPTEKEWEYAARAGTAEARYGPLDDIAWHEANSGGMPHPGGLKQPNAFGLYDMLGNVWEWTSNKYDYGEGVAYIARGGSWHNKPDDLRASQKFGFMTPIRPGYTGPGVRCVWVDAPF